MPSFENAIPHDAVIEGILIDRTRPGENDSVIINLLAFDNTKILLSFMDIYHAQLDLNFGIIASESVRNVSIEFDNPKIQEIRSAWGSLGVNLEVLKCFVLETNSTKSRIKIYATDFHISDL